MLAPFSIRFYGCSHEKKTLPNYGRVRMASKPKDYIFIWMILTSNTEVTENEVEFLITHNIHSKGISVP